MTDETARALLYRHGVPEDIIDGALTLHAQELAAATPAEVRDRLIFAIGEHTVSECNRCAPDEDIADAVLAVLPAPAATVLTEAERAALEYALTLADDEFTRDGAESIGVDEDALVALRRLVGAEQAANRTAEQPDKRRALLTLSTPCAACSHPYNWHVGGVCQAGADTKQCDCIAFAQERP